MLSNLCHCEGRLKFFLHHANTAHQSQSHYASGAADRNKYADTTGLHQTCSPLRTQQSLHIRHWVLGMLVSGLSHHALAPVGNTVRETLHFASSTKVTHSCQDSRNTQSVDQTFNTPADPNIGKPLHTGTKSNNDQQLPSEIHGAPAVRTPEGSMLCSLLRLLNPSRLWPGTSNTSTTLEHRHRHQLWQQQK